MVSGSPSLSTTATPASGVGSYAITATLGSLAAANYTFTFVNGTLTVNAAALTVTAQNASRAYGAANPTFTANITGLVNGDTQSVVSGSPSLSTTATPASGVGSYAITASAGTLTATNYTFSFVPGTLTVNAAALTVTAQNAVRAYGAANPTFSASITGLVNGDMQSVVSGSPSLSTTATPASGVGSYAITATLGSLAATNYTFSFVPGTLTVNAATLTVTAQNASRTYGAANPAFSAIITGFVNGDTVSVVSGSASLSTTATQASAVGGYAISSSLGTLAAANYMFGFVNGTLTITPATASVTPNAASKTYGTLDPALSGTLTGFLAADNVTATYTRAPGETVAGGPYTISATLSPTGVLGNYSITSNTAMFTIRPAPLIVTANPAQMIYGSPVPAFTANYTGFVNGDTVSVVSGSASLSTTATHASAVGSYAITATAGTLAAANYTFTFVNGMLTVNAAALTVTAQNAARTYGAANPAFSAIITGFVNGDTVSVVTGSPILSTTATPASGVGSYAITATTGTLAAANYTFTFAPGTLTVNAATLTVTAQNASRTYGAANPAFSAIITGFVNGDTVSVVTGSANLSTAATANSTVGPYLIIASQGTLSATNYTFTFVNGTLTITAATPTVTWNNPVAITYGTALGGTQLNASAGGVLGSFAYAPPAGTVLNAGVNQTLSVTFTPTDSTDYTTQAATVTITVNQAPSSTTFTSSVNPSTLGAPVTFTATVSSSSGGTPTGTVMFNDGSTSLGTSVLVSGQATFSASVLAAGAHSITAAYGGDGNFRSSTSSALSQTVNQAAAITSANSATFSFGTSGSFTVTATGFPVPTLSQTGALPAGMMFNNATGVLGGTPTASGSFPITITAHNGVGTDATQSFTLTVNQAAAITSGNSATFIDGIASSFTVTATGFPTPTLSESGALPAGVMFNTATGVLGGTPTASGLFPINITAHNGVGVDAVQNFTLTVSPPILQSITINALSPSIAKGTSDQFTATGTLSDGTTQDLTNSATWTSTNPAVATISSAGSAFGIGVGSTSISATSAGIMSNTLPLTVTAATLRSITISAAKPSIANGTTDQFTAKGIFTDGSMQDLTGSVIWASSNPAVATITAAGLATGASVGSSNISASFNGITSNLLPLTVTPAVLQSIAIRAQNGSIAKGTNDEFTASGTFSDNSTQDLTNSVAWTSSNLTAVKIDASGVATGANIGSSDISASQNGVASNTFTLTVTAAVLNSIIIGADSTSIAKGTSNQFIALGTFSDGTVQEVTDSANWVCSDPMVVSVDPTGLATGVNVGSCNISATQNEVTSNSFELTITAAVLQLIFIGADTTSTAKGTTDQFSAVGVFSDGTIQDLTETATWTSSNPAVATIAPMGLASGVGLGTSNISATQNGTTSDTYALTVTDAVLRSITIASDNGTIAKGTTNQFTATGHFSDGTTQDLTNSVMWTSSGPSVNINATGLANGLSPGSSNITATQNAIASNTLALAVSDTVVQSITITAASGTIANGLTEQLNATATLSDGTMQNVTHSATWASSSPAVATISAVGGVATGLTLGSTNISATENGVTSDPFVLTVTTAVLQSIAVTPATPSIVKGSAQQFTATGTYSDGSTQDVSLLVTWTSSDTNIATISSAGFATGVAAGSVIITAAQNGVSGLTPLIVDNPPPSITSLLPNILPITGTAQTLTINGSNFDNNSTVTYNGAPHFVTLFSASQLTIQLSAADLAMAGVFPVVVTNPQPGGGSSAASFSVAGLVVTPAALDFGSVPDGIASMFQIGTLTAVGTAVTVNSPTVSNNAFSVTGPGAPLQFPLQLAAGDTFPFIVTFNPLLDSPGLASGTVTFGGSTNAAAQTVSGTGTAIVQLTWQPSPTPDAHYNVYRCGDVSPLVADARCSSSQNGFDYTYIASVGDGILTYTDLSASSGKYYYIVTAVDTGGNESDKSAISDPAIVP
ncbi:MAG TPA: MBG domain-containing protein [Terriglobales bacterium]|nr:MBG domain-containing protein [Terriglobales bacterium]